MMIVGTKKFSGIAPRIANYLKSEDMADMALNADVSSGALVPYRNLTTTSIVVESDADTIYRSKNSGLWDSAPGVWDIARSPMSNDAYDRAYLTSDGTVPLMCQNWQIADGFLYDIGVPAPSSFLATPVGEIGDDPLLATSRSYLLTYVSAYGEEGPPSPPSGMINIYDGNTVNVEIPNAPVGNHNIVAVNIYRTNTGTASTDFQLVASVSVGSGTYSDSIADDQLGVVCPSEGWDSPPSDMLGICNHPAGFLAGFHGREVCLSERWLPHAWPYTNRYPVDDEIVGLGVYGNSILVMTTCFPFIITGEDPSLMTVEKLEVEGACLSRRGIVDMGYFVIYPAVDGLIGVGVGSGPQNLTEKIADRLLWKDVDPGSIIACRYGDKYVAVCSGIPGMTGFVFDTKSGSLMPIDVIGIKAMFYDVETELFYVRRNSNAFLEVWDNGDYGQLHWYSKMYKLPYQMNISCGQIFAAGEVEVNIIIDGVSIFNKTVNGTDVFRLPAGTRYDNFQYKLSSSDPIYFVAFATSAAELGGV